MKCLPIGVTRAYEELRKVKSIDHLPPHYQKEPLNTVRCRELFSYLPSIHISEEGGFTEFKPISANARDILLTYSLDGYVDRLVHFLSLIKR
jgi:hypothetical protein